MLDMLNNQLADEEIQLNQAECEFEASGEVEEPVVAVEESEPEELREVAGMDAESLFSADVRQTTVLSRAEEETLARQIVAARKRVHRQLRAARRLSRAALADFGRGVVLPEQDFREREAIAILQFAEEQLRLPPRSKQAATVGLGRRELRAFVRDLSAALADYRVVRDQMVQANVRLVMVLARRHRHPSLTFLDLVQEGMLGLIRAVEKYEPGRNVKFSTYAVYWIWQQMARAADTLGELIRTPVHWNQMRRRVGRETQGPAERNATAAGDDEEPRLDPNKLAVMTRSFRFVSTDAPVGEDDDRPMESLLADDGVQPEAHTFQGDLRGRLEDMVERLPAREAEILRRRFGLGNDETETLEEVGVRLGVSRERIRQLENRALKQLRELCVEAGLQEYLH